jgi:selenocysteine lyase/cysteine desulfurase
VERDPQFLREGQIENIDRKVRGNGNNCYGSLTEIGCKVLTPENKKNRHGLIMYTTGDYDLGATSYKKFNAEWSGEKPIKLCHRGIGGVVGLRISNHFFNFKADIDYLVDAQKKILDSQCEYFFSPVIPTICSTCSQCYRLKWSVFIDKKIIW